MTASPKPIKIDIKDLDRKQLDVVRHRFMGINQRRLMRIRESSGDMLKLVLDALPVLIHVNHPLLPGYQNQETPCAICDYSPSKIELTTTKRIAKSFSLQKRAFLRRDILSLFMMGSMGTLGQSSSSDLDIWVVHANDLDAIALKSLQQKLTGIELWAKELGISLHFFMMHPDYFKEQHDVTMDQENCGTSQHFLLLDEFYRTALLIAGRFPLWWLIPPEQEQHYENFANHLVKKRFVRDGDWIDFGGVHNIPVEEYFGAALWHMNKAIEYPYKSTLKIMLMETYAADHPKVTPLCHTFKEKVYNGFTEPSEIDAYLLIYRKVELYLNSNQDEDRLEWVRKCLYLKTAERLSINLRTKKDRWRRDLMQQLIDQWGWERDHLLQLDARRHWKVLRTIEERNILVREMTQSYRFLSHFARIYASEMNVSSQDMTILGRKLYASFERRSEKIDRINPGISPDLTEPELSFFYSADGGNKNIWSLYRGIILPNEVDYNKPLKKHKNLLEIVSWIFVNGLIKKTTKIAVLGNNAPITASQLNTVIRKIDSYFPRVEHVAQEEAYQQIAKSVKTLYLINISEYNDKNNPKKDYHLISDLNDPLSYGSRRENLIFSVDMLSVNSWNEVTVRRFTGQGTVLRLLQHAYQSQQANPLWSYKLACEIGSYANAITLRLKKVLKQVLNFQPASPPARYIWQVATHYQFLGITKDRIEPSIFENENDLMKMLASSDSRGEFITTAFDENCLKDEPLQIISKHALIGEVNVYLFKTNSLIKIWVSDEAGALIHIEKKYDRLSCLIKTYSLFFEMVANRQFVLGETIEIRKVNFYQLNFVNKRWRKKKLSAQIDFIPKRFFPIQAIVENQNSETSHITIYCDGATFSEQEYGKQLYTKIAHYIYAKRNYQAKYPIYITDLELSQLTHEGALSSCLYLKYKWEIENKLDNALKNINQK